MKEKIDTIAKLRALVGRKVYAKIGNVDGIPLGNMVKCLVSIDDSICGKFKDAVFLLQDTHDGERCVDLKGYKYSWVCDNDYHFNEEVRILREVGDMKLPEVLAKEQLKIVTPMLMNAIKVVEERPKWEVDPKCDRRLFNCASRFNMIVRSVSIILEVDPLLDKEGFRMRVEDANLVLYLNGFCERILPTLEIWKEKSDAFGKSGEMYPKDFARSIAELFLYNSKIAQTLLENLFGAELTATYRLGIDEIAQQTVLDW